MSTGQPHVATSLPLTHASLRLFGLSVLFAVRGTGVLAPRVARLPKYRPSTSANLPVGGGDTLAYANARGPTAGTVNCQVPIDWCTNGEQTTRTRCETTLRAINVTFRHLSARCSVVALRLILYNCKKEVFVNQETPERGIHTSCLTGCKA